MKKLLFAMLAASALTGCGRQEKLTLEQALLAKMEADSDLKDYKIDPQEMAACVLNEIADSLPVMAVDTRRGAYYDAYAKFLTITTPQEAKKAIDEATPLFGTPQDARKAAFSITDHVMTCMGQFTDRTAPPERETQAAPEKEKPAQ